jgi:hypothetical protein
LLVDLTHHLVPLNIKRGTSVFEMDLIPVKGNSSFHALRLRVLHDTFGQFHPVPKATPCFMNTVAELPFLSTHHLYALQKALNTKVLG